MCNVEEVLEVSRQNVSGGGDTPLLRGELPGIPPESPIRYFLSGQNGPATFTVFPPRHRTRPVIPGPAVKMDRGIQARYRLQMNDLS